ncbi:hypothetical protein JHK84_047721 [Glycine max]|nr:hypothetical protein JHK84_047721 [Glycine max]
MLQSSIAELLHSDKPSSVDSSPEGFIAMTKLQIWKNDISQSHYNLNLGDGMPCHNAKSCDKEIGDYNNVTRCPEPSQISPSDDDNSIERMMFLSTNLHDMHDTTKENDINSLGIETPKFQEAQPLIKMVSSLGGGSSFSSLMAIENVMKAHTSAGFYSGIDNDTLPNTIISSNRETRKVHHSI